MQKITKRTFRQVYCPYCNALQPRMPRADGWHRVTCAACNRTYEFEPKEIKYMQYSYKVILLLALLLAALTSCTSVQPLCRHSVLEHYTAYVDAGYEAEIWHMKNLKECEWPFHIAVRVRRPGESWRWVNQPTRWLTLGDRPKDVILLREVPFSEVADAYK